MKTRFMLCLVAFLCAILMTFLPDPVVAQMRPDFGSCVPGYHNPVIGGTQFNNVPFICTDSTNQSQPGYLPIGTRVRITPPFYTGSVGERDGTISVIMWSWFPDGEPIETRYIIKFTPDSGMYLDTAAMLEGQFQVIQ